MTEDKSYKEIKTLLRILERDSMLIQMEKLQNLFLSSTCVSIPKPLPEVPSLENTSPRPLGRHLALFTWLFTWNAPLQRSSLAILFSSFFF